MPDENAPEPQPQPAVSRQQFDEKSKARKDILWGYYQEHRTHARHNETLRTTVNNILFVASAALVTLTGLDKCIDDRDLPGAFLLVGFGILGFLFSASYTEKVGRHKSRSEQYFCELNELFFSDLNGERDLRQIVKDADQQYKNFGVQLIKKVGKSFTLWSILPLLISLIGAFLIYNIYTNNKTPPCLP